MKHQDEFLELMEISTTLSKQIKPEMFKSLYEWKAPIEMTLNEYIWFTVCCRNEKYQSLTIDMTKDKNTGRYRLGLKSVIVPDGSPF